jgi:cell division protein FtsI (penicillin-binding protein 3)/stage V sporulation protein D (sporulation-specific penicillin-binding protein)
VTARLANRRIRLLVAVFAALFAVTLLRATWLQAVKAPSLETIASRQQRETVTLPARRGTILDRTGEELAIGQQAITVYANPRHVRNPRLAAPVVARALDLDPGDVLALLSDRSRGFVYLARKADPAKAKALERRELPGIGFYPEEKRVYPQHRVAASVVGYAGVDNSGLAGLEKAYDRVLTGKAGEETIVHDPTGRVLDVVDVKPVTQGKELTLTLDDRLQAEVEEVLRRTRAAWSAKDATAVVLDPRTGGVLAMAQEPGYDANAYGSVFAASPDVVRARAVTDTYEPGSTFKVVTVAAALQERLVSPSTTFTLPYEIQVADRRIHDAEERGTEVMTVAQILSRSSNVGAITLAQLLGERRLARWIDRFGFGRPTGIDFPGESRGIVLPLAEWTGSTIGNVPIGQGIAVTPIQMAAVYGAIANGGRWIAPHLVERIGGKEVRPPAHRRIVSKRTAALLTGMLSNVVEEGTGVEAQVPGYTVAGKTGTAAKPDPSGGYSDSRYVASFVGFVPARNPRLVVLVTVDEPHGAIFGGTVAAPAFKEIAQWALEYFGVAPDAPQTAAPG